MVVCALDRPPVLVDLVTKVRTEVHTESTNLPSSRYVAAFSCDGKLLLTGDAKGLVRVMDLQTLKVLRTIQGPHQQVKTIILNKNNT